MAQAKPEASAKPQAKRSQAEDEVTEASMESFPASDPPAFTPTHSGGPHEEPGTPADVTEAARKPEGERIAVSGAETCQGRILLKTPFARAVFVGGIALVVILGLIAVSL